MYTQGLTKIIDEVVDKVLVDLEKSFQEILRDVEALIKKEREETLRSAEEIVETFEKRSEMMKSRISSLTQVKVRGRKLEVLEECVNKVVERTLEVISEKAERGELDEQLEKMLKEAMDIVNVKRLKVYTSLRLRERLRTVIKNLPMKDVDIVVEDEPVETVFGIIVKSSDGSISYDNRIETKLERLRPEIKKTVALLIS
ncbi:MAG: V-type ATP synthase subunit E family protein [Aigarchaeota archaeon]|nr:V-type ATP synthase subunit E family protein [Aigarchaeota archaeon]MCX8192366.1 V-type ATP synthase subunit E family protein [Nitrososphaeria archaeon]MDW7986965.1 V-type ATP synthase subunit E family protein [Nitrososphaerota archaeon]